MSTFYCHACALKLGLISAAVSVNYTASVYQREKFFKHTTPTGYYSFVSVYDDPSYPTYQNVAVSAQNFGCLEIDNQKRKNLIAPAGNRIGGTFLSGNLYREDDAVKLVYPNDSTRTHHFSTGSSGLYGERCASCGGALT
jgi:hypothetical protein